jgi:hypothetical protein
MCSAVLGDMNNLCNLSVIGKYLNFLYATRVVALDIAAALKNNLLNYGKRTDFWHLVLLGKRSCLRSRHLVLWSLGTLTGQQRFYGSGLVT